MLVSVVQVLAPKPPAESSVKLYEEPAVIESITVVETETGSIMVKETVTLFEFPAALCA